MSIGIAYPGEPSDAGTWSGIPASLADALRQLGNTVVALRAEAPAAVSWAAAHSLTLTRLHRTSGPGLVARARVARTVALYNTREMAALRGWGLRSQLRRAGDR